MESSEGIVVRKRKELTGREAAAVALRNLGRRSLSIFNKELNSILNGLDWRSRI